LCKERKLIMQRIMINLFAISSLATILLWMLWTTLASAPVNAHINQASSHSIPTTQAHKQTGEGGIAAIEVTKTVGLDPDVCATSDQLMVTAGTAIVYCYFAVNTGDITLTNHTVEDDKIGVLLDNQVITLTPGPNSIVFFTAALFINATTINTVTWYATNQAGDQAVATDATAVLVPAIVVTHTVGVDPNACADRTILDAPTGALITHCYTVQNRGPITLVTHHIMDSQSGVITDAHPFVLPPGAQTSLTVTHLATQTTTTIVTWTAGLTEDLYAVASAAATVRVPAIKAQLMVSEQTGCILNNSNTLTITVGFSATYCYLVTNIGGITLTTFTITDKILGSEPITLLQGLSPDTTLWFTLTSPVTQSITNTVTWLATTGQGMVATDQAIAHVVALSQLEAFIFRDVDCDGLYEPPEPELDKIGVGLRLANRPPLTRTTNTAGIVRFFDLPQGVYTIKLDATNLPEGHELRDADLTRTLTVTSPNIYTINFPLSWPADTDTDADGSPDCEEGSGDSDGDGAPNYMDNTQRLYLTTVMR
jgi:hypothetical protein